MNASVHLARIALAAVGLWVTGHASAAADGAGQGTTLPAVMVTGDGLAAGVKAAVFAAVGEKSPDITVHNDDGRVSLGGWARTGADVSRATAVASRVPGVKVVYANGVRLWSTRTSDY